MDMSRTAVNFVLDVGLFVAFVALVAIAIVVDRAFPAASAAGGMTLWGLTHDEWLAWQFRAIMVLAIGVGLHLILHWAWVCGFVAARLSKLVGRRITTNESTRTVYGVITLIIVLVLLVTLVAAAERSLRGSSAVVPSPSQRGAHAASPGSNRRMTRAGRSPET